MSRSALADVFAGCQAERTGSSSVMMFAVSIRDSSENTWLAVMDAVRTSADKWRFVYLQAITGHARDSTVWTQGWSTCRTHRGIWTRAKKGIPHFFTTISCSLSAMTIRDSKDSNCIKRAEGQER
jgi:hypothetical protein